MDGHRLRSLLHLRLEELLGGVQDEGAEAAGGRLSQGTLNGKTQAVIVQGRSVLVLLLREARMEYIVIKP